jgi:hypothetical protein
MRVAKQPITAIAREAVPEFQIEATPGATKSFTLAASIDREVAGMERVVTPIFHLVEEPIPEGGRS